jgi:hypothetical protein
VLNCLSGSIGAEVLSSSLRSVTGGKICCVLVRIVKLDHSLPSVGLCASGGGDLRGCRDFMEAPGRHSRRVAPLRLTDLHHPARIAPSRRCDRPAHICARGGRLYWRPCPLASLSRGTPLCRWTRSRGSIAARCSQPGKCVSTVAQHIVKTVIRNAVQATIRPGVHRRGHRRVASARGPFDGSYLKQCQPCRFSQLHRDAPALKRIREQHLVTEDLAEPVTVELVTSAQSKVQDQAMISLMTFPATSVRRKSRPL